MTKPVIVLMVLTVLAYLGVLFHPFVHDDVVLIQQRAASELSSSSPQPVTSLFFQLSSPTGMAFRSNPYYRPILEIYYRLAYSVFHSYPFGYHLVNVCLHMINGLLLLVLMGRLTQRRWLSWGVAALFLLHPVQTEAVTSIVGISNVLMSAFLLGAIYFYMSAGSPGKRVRTGRTFMLMGASLVLYGLALLTKEQAVILPLILVLYEGMFRKKPAWPNEPVSSKCWRIGIMLGGTGVYFFWRKILIGQTLVDLKLFSYEFWLRLWNIPRTLLIDMRVLLLPTDLHYYRSLDILKPAGTAVLALLIGIIILVVVCRRLDRENRHLVAFGCGWFVITLAPMLNVIPLVHEYSLIAMFEHFLYLPAAGFWLALMAGADQTMTLLFKEKERVVKTAVLMSVIGLCLGMTWQQNITWRGEIPLFERAVAYEPQLARARVLLGKAYYFDGQFDRAIDELLAALAIMEQYDKLVRADEPRIFYRGYIKGIHFDLAQAFEARGAFPETVMHYQAALDMDPDDHVILNNIGMAFARWGRLAEAEPFFQKALDAYPQDVMAMSNLAICYLEKGNEAEAEHLLMQALGINPHFEAAQQNLGRLQQHRLTDEASQRLGGGPKP